MLVVGAPLRHSNRLYNCAVVIHRGELLGVVPKSFLPNYREYYEQRWFAPGDGHVGRDIRVARPRGAVRNRPAVRGPRRPRLRLPRRDLRGHLGADAAVDLGALAGAPCC